METVHFYGRDFFNEMVGGRDLSRRLAECIHEAIGAPQKALDLGAGIGTQTARLQELGWEIRGGDFAPIAAEMRDPGVEISPFDLTLPAGGGAPQDPVDCVICTEVAEHVPEQFSGMVIANVVSLARKFIVWSAAPPGQDGTGHINCQPPQYWLDRLKAANWVESHGRTKKLRARMRATGAQHSAYADSFYVLIPVDNTEEFYEFMRSCREPYRRLAECIHAVVGSQSSALDIGCGIGLQTTRLKELGWSIGGADFAPVAIEMREPGIDVAAFDLTAGLEQGAKKYSCVICTETAEHINARHADRIVANVAGRAENFIVWSAACPWQVEPYHINLQHPEYWLTRFRMLGWGIDEDRTAKLRFLMQKTNAQHVLGKENFCVLVPSGRPLHMTIVSTVLNGEKWIGTHLATVASQTFRNYEHVVIDAKSDDSTDAIVQAEQAADPQLTLRLNVARRKSALENCWEVWKDLPDDEVIVWLDGDDWLAHDQALEIIARAYCSSSEPWLTYGQFMFQDGEVGFASPYPKDAHARLDPVWRATHLKTFRAGLVKQLNPEDIQRPDGSWVDLAIDRAIMWPLLEMAGDRYACIHQILSVYNYDASWGVNRPAAELQVELDEVARLRKLTPYPQLSKRPW